ncbi:MAG: tRNA uridine-5-carboxymethylaminomethyl(34) synthesis GTPase MnmE, partial [Bacteroidetes bacterium]
MALPDLNDTIVALATPPGTGAIAVIRLAGPQAISLADRIFRGRILASQATHTAHFGRIEDEQGNTVDEVLVTVFHAPRSYTGDNAVEISCHGSPYIQQAIIELCLRQGARMAQPGEFTLRAYLNGKLDLSQAEAVADLVASQSAAAHQVALRQLRGGFKTEIAQLREELIHFASLVELELDFSEEDVEFADRTALKELVEKIRRYIRALTDSFQLGNALKTGVAT